MRRLALGLEANLPPIVAEAGGKSERVRQLGRANPGDTALTEDTLYARAAVLGASHDRIAAGQPLDGDARAALQFGGRHVGVSIAFHNGNHLWLSRAHGRAGCHDQRGEQHSSHKVDSAFVCGGGKRKLPHGFFRLLPPEPALDKLEPRLAALEKAVSARSRK